MQTRKKYHDLRMMAAMPLALVPCFLTSDTQKARGIQLSSNFSDSQGLCRSKLNFIGSHSPSSSDVFFAIPFPQVTS